MNDEKLKEEDYANYSKLINTQFIEYARKEVISNREAHERFLNCFTELYGPLPCGPEILENVLNGNMVLPSKICVSACKKFFHCPIIGVLNTLIKGELNSELIDT